MTPKERAVMQQALEALDVLLTEPMAKTAADKAEALLLRAAPAMREALAGDNMTPTEQVELNLNCKSVQARLATSWGYVKAEQAEQEPVDFEGDAWIGDTLLPEDTPLYAAPVRTKDLTDDEIFKTNKTELPDCQDLVDFARAVIVADRSKNGIV